MYEICSSSERLLLYILWKISPFVQSQARIACRIYGPEMHRDHYPGKVVFLPVSNLLRSSVLNSKTEQLHNSFLASSAVSFPFSVRIRHWNSRWFSIWTVSWYTVMIISIVHLFVPHLNWTISNDFFPPAWFEVSQQQLLQHCPHWLVHEQLLLMRWSAKAHVYWMGPGLLGNSIFCSINRLSDLSCPWSFFLMTSVSSCMVLFISVLNNTDSDNATGLLSFP